MRLYFKDMHRITRRLVYILAILSIALVAVRDGVNQTTVALALLLVVLFVATFLGSRPALVASVVGMLSFNYFFLPPYGALTIADPQNWIALTAFLITAATVGWLSARARGRATEAEQKGREVARLYAELQAAFEQARHAEALRQSERLKSALLDAVTHDIRTPLTSIKASVTTLLDERPGGTSHHIPVRLDDDDRQEMLEIIDEEADRLNRFIEGMIELARIEAGELYLRRWWGVVDEIIGAALARAEKFVRHHRVTVEIEPELPALLVDPRAVSEVVYTLIDNAAKYSPQGSIICITAKRARRRGADRRRR